MAAETFPSQFKEETTIAVMGKLKFSNRCLEALHKQINKALDAAETLVLADPTNVALHHFLLGQMEIHHRDKTVATHPVPMKNAKGQPVLDKGKPVMVEQSIRADIKDDDNWRVQVTKGGSVRICLTAKGVAAVKEKFKGVAGLKVYE